MVVTSSGASRFLVRQRGHFFGAVAAGLFFWHVAPGTEGVGPEAFRLMGGIMFAIGAALSVLAVAVSTTGKGHR